MIGVRAKTHTEGISPLTPIINPWQLTGISRRLSRVARYPYENNTGMLVNP